MTSQIYTLSSILKTNEVQRFYDIKLKFKHMRGSRPDPDSTLRIRLRNEKFQPFRSRGNPRLYFVDNVDVPMFKGHLYPLLP